MSDDIQMIEATVKWYNPKKGYGFVNYEGFPDIFLHCSTLDAVGLKTIFEGDKIVCDIIKNQEGYQIIKIHEVKFDHSEDDISINEDIYDVLGEIKWYNSMRGFGFIYSAKDGSEIYFHSSILHPSMYKDLIPGRKVSASYFETPKGKEAREILFV